MDMVDPILVRKIKDIKGMIQLIDTQLANVDSHLLTEWNTFKDSNKENREAMQIPSLETIYQAMVVHNNVMMRQKSKVDELEIKLQAHNRKKMLRMINGSRMLNDSPDLELSKIVDDVLSLNLDQLKRENTLRSLEETLPNITFNSSNLENPKTNMVVLHQSLNENIYQKENPAKSGPHVSTRQMLPTANPHSGSISSGQPVIQNSSTKVSTAFKGETPISVVNSETTPSQVKQASEVPKSNYKFNFATPEIPTAKFSLQNTTPQTIHNTVSVFGGSVSKASSAQTTTYPAASTGLSTGAFTSVSSSSLATQQSTLTAPSVSKGFSFAPLSINQAPFSASPGFGLTSQTSPTSQPQPFLAKSTKAFSFSTTSLTSAPSTFTSSFKTDTSQTSVPSANNIGFKVTPSESSFVSSAPAPVPIVNTSPLASLSSLVSGIEPLKATSSPQKIQLSEANATKTSTPQPFVFKVSTQNENKVNSGGVFVQSSNVFGGQQVENKPETKGSSVNNQKGGDGQPSGAFKKLSFDSSPPKTVFGGSPQTQLGAITATQELTSKNIFNFPTTNPSSTSSFGSSFAIPSAQKSKSIFTSSASILPNQEKQQTESIQSKTVNPVIELSLTSSKTALDEKASLEKLSAKKDIVITKVESPEVKSQTPEKVHKETNPTSFFNPNSFTTPTKAPQTIFGGSSPAKPAVMYEVDKTTGEFSSAEQKNKETQLGSAVSKPETTSTQIGGAAASQTLPATSFSFSSLNLQTTPSSTESNQSTQNSEFNFGPKSEVTTAPSTGPVTTSQNTSAFSFTLAVSQPSTTAFTFSMPATTSSNSFSFANPTSEASGDKSKTTFSFGQLNTPSSTTMFGGAGSKPAATSNIFGLATSTAGDSGTNTSQTPSSSAETKSIFGQSAMTAATTTSASTLENKTSTTVVSDTKTIFGQSSSTENKSIFGQAAATTTETKSVFGQPSSNTVENKSIFGQTPSTPAETKSIFGQSLENKNVSVFGQSNVTTTESNSGFGQTAAPTETKNMFGQAAENKAVFGQQTLATSSSPSDFSFSLSLSSTTTPQTSFFGTPSTNSAFGAPATTSASFFGQPICSPASTVSSPFGQPAATPASTASSPFGQPATTPSFGAPATQSPFGSTSAFGSKPTFGQSTGSFFGQSSGGFGSTGGGSLFGGSSSPSVFGSAAPQQPQTSPFGQSTAFGSASPPPAFGAPPSFGGAPTFGGSPAFGSPPKLFGTSTASPTSVFGGGGQQQSSTFENLATQQTMSFGNLAQSQPTAFGSPSPFSAPQAAASTPQAFPQQQQTNTVFGGTSFSSWR